MWFGMVANGLRGLWLRSFSFPYNVNSLIRHFYFRGFMNLFFVTTCKGRAQHLEITLPKNLADNKTAIFVVLNYNSQDHLLEYLKAAHRRDIESGRLIIYSFYDAPTFRMAHAKNMAHRLGILEGGDILVNLDADNFTGPDFDEYVLGKFREEESFLWSRMVKDGPNRLPRGISGRIAVTKEQFLNVGGYDERFETWSPDDKDFNTRLRNIGYLAHEIDPRFLQGLLHTDKMRFKEYPHAEADSDGESFEEIRYSKATVVNYGRFGMGKVFKNFDHTPIVLGPVPTRLFGIGMHKTGTTSLHESLKTLGLDSAHWKSAHWAKAIWDEMALAGRSPTLEKSYALCDLPITLMFRELDKAYPGSKFILTTRDESKWIMSVENHWNPVINPFREAWDSDPFTHRVHRELYGRKTFDREAFIERFRRHNADVAEHFKGRPGDLLTINVDRDPTWGPLCRFLDKKVPTGKYPQAFKTKAIEVETAPLRSVPASSYAPEYCI
jgi:Sulfotransferase domain/N-terminal domain of galactosyltransferase